MVDGSGQRKKLEAVSAILKEAESLLIVMQDNPDPDSLASSVAFRQLAKSLGEITCSIVCGGTVGRGENRALVKYLGLNLRSFDGLDVSQFDAIAMVDTQPQTGNNSLGEGIIPDIVIDHHPFRRASGWGEFHDVRNRYGSTSTILVEYLQAAGVAPDVRLATALLYGIRSDTQDLGMQGTRVDAEAIEYLFPLANKRMLSEIQNGRLQREYFQMLVDALGNARVHGRGVITTLGEASNPDMNAEVADLLLRDDEITWALCYGFCQGKLQFSIRTSETEPKADKVARSVVSRRGTGGGHASRAGGQLPLKKDTKAERAKLEKFLRGKFLRVLGLEGVEAARLVKV